MSCPFSAPRRVFLAVLIVVVGLCPAHSRAQGGVEVTTCGQVVTDKAFLTADLDCTGFEGDILGAAVVLAKRRSLDLRGFTIRGGRVGVLCAKLSTRSPTVDVASCKVFGGGEITASTLYGIEGKRVKVTDVALSNHGSAGMDCKSCRVVNSPIVDSEIGIRCNRGVRVVDSTISGNSVAGIAGRAVALRGSTAIGNGVDILSVRKPRLRDSTCGTSNFPGVCVP